MDSMDTYRAVCNVDKLLSVLLSFIYLVHNCIESNIKCVFDLVDRLTPWALSHVPRVIPVQFLWRCRACCPAGALPCWGVTASGESLSWGGVLGWLRSLGECCMSSGTHINARRKKCHAMLWHPAASWVSCMLWVLPHLLLRFLDHGSLCISVAEDGWSKSHTRMKGHFNMHSLQSHLWYLLCIKTRCPP